MIKLGKTLGKISLGSFFTCCHVFSFPIVRAILHSVPLKYRPIILPSHRPFFVHLSSSFRARAPRMAVHKTGFNASTEATLTGIYPPDGFEDGVR